MAMRSGWGILRTIAVMQVVAIALVFMQASNQVAALHATIRLTARVSVVLFLLAFTATAAYRCWPNVVTAWQRQQRRYLGVSFALSHGIHLAAILWLGVIATDDLAAATRQATWIFGSIAYVFIVMMTVTSFDAVRRRMSVSAWRWLHTLGAYYIWLIFANSYISRAAKQAEYIAPAVLVVSALLLRVFVWFRQRRKPLVAA